LELERIKANSSPTQRGSDGIDGNTSGRAIADPTTVPALMLLVSSEVVAAAFDSCPMFTALGDAVVTGPTARTCAIFAC